MKKTGISIAAIGVALVAYAMFVFDPTVSSVASFGDSDRIINMHRQQHQLMMVMVGCTATLAGLILFGISRLAPETDRTAQSAAEAEFGAEMSDPEFAARHRRATRLGVVKRGENYDFFGTIFDDLDQALAHAERYAGPNTESA